MKKTNNGSLNLDLPKDTMLAAANKLQQYISFACSGIIEVTRLMEGIDGWFTVPAGAALYTSGLLAPAEQH